MECTLRIILAILILTIPLACVSFNEFSDKKAQLEQCQERNDLIASDLKDMEAERLRQNEHQAILKAKLLSSEEMAANCVTDMSDLQAQYDYVKKINKQLSQNNQKLERDLQKQKSVIILQEKVIRLLDDTKKTIESSLKDQIDAKDIEVVESENQVKMILVDKILFESGSVDVSEEGRALLKIIANSIRDSKSQNIVVEGHTDNKPISGRLKNRFPSNWELSTARASAVVRFLQNSGNLPALNLSVHGYSFYRPLASNETEEGRSQNRRIEIILTPQKN
jgi:chemotaxis protein MotB